MEQAAKANIIQQLQKEVLSLQGFKAACDDQRLQTGLGAIEKAFPYERFPTGAIHELLSYGQENAAATSGFLSALVSRFMQTNGFCLWVSTRRTVFPPALKLFGIEPERVLFIDVTKEKEALWAFEEALKCEALTVVVGEWSELSFAQSRRLQLAVEESHVTGFIHRYSPRSENNTACVSRWKVTPLPSSIEAGMPGVGFPCWHIELSKVRNGRPGAWDIEWSENNFKQLTPEQDTTPQIISIRQTG